MRADTSGTSDCEFPGCENAAAGSEHYCEECQDEMRPPRVD